MHTFVGYESTPCQINNLVLAYKQYFMQLISWKSN